jgi:hypothetical protein
MKRILFALTLNLLFALSFVVQAQSERKDSDVKSKIESTKKSKPPKRKSQKNEGGETKSDAKRFWLYAQVSSVFDTNILHDEQSLNSFGLVPSLGAHFQNDAEKPSLEADYEVALHRYGRTDEFDRTSHNLEVSYRRQFARRWYARTTGEVSIKGSSEDRDINNQYILEQQIQYRLNPANRLAVFAAYRVKHYPLADAAKSAIDPYFGGRFQQRLPGERGWGLSYRYDKNRSRGEKDRYVRSTYGAEFFTPVFNNRHDLLTLGAGYAPRLYARQVKVDDVRVPRHDRRWKFDALYERPLGQDVRLGLSYGFEKRTSNDPDKKFNSHLFGVTFNFKWWSK